MLYKIQISIMDPSGRSVENAIDLNFAGGIPFQVEISQIFSLCLWGGGGQPLELPVESAQIYFPQKIGSVL